LGQHGLEICHEVFASWQQFRQGSITRAELGKLLKPLRQRMKQLLSDHSCGPVKRPAKFCRALLKLEEAMWTFAQVEGIEPTNNHAERMLRPAVMWRKQSQGSHSLAGCRFVERMMTAVQTLRLGGRLVVDYLQETLLAFRHGLPPPPLPT
jgi:transposase